MAKGMRGGGKRTYEPTGRPGTRNLPVIISKPEIHRGRDDALSGLPAGIQLRKREAGGKYYTKGIGYCEEENKRRKEVVKREFTI